MRTSLAAASAALVAVACATAPARPASASAGAVSPAIEVHATGTPGRASAHSTQRVSATVVSVDLGARALALDLGAGGVQTIRVGPEVAGLGAIGAGDVIEIELEQGFLLEVQPAGSETVAPQGVVAEGPPPEDGAPGGALAAAVRATVTVVAVDLASRMVVVEGQAGSRCGIKAGPGIQLERLKIGDRLLATYLEAVAVRLEKAGTKL
ncbi:MAG TPA: hypothetical protein VFP65_14410 [Anaeromyxobacteraceae bacterium]|nr:hypothetical protein [Anaeromyxobacteraceae bacterium]